MGKIRPQGRGAKDNRYIIVHINFIKKSHTNSCEHNSVNIFCFIHDSRRTNWNGETMVDIDGSPLQTDTWMAGGQLWYLR